MGGVRKQSAISLDHTCSFCGVLIRGSINHLVMHIVKRHSEIKSPKRYKKCGHKIEAHIKTVTCDKTTFDVDGLREIQEWNQHKKLRYAEVQQQFEKQRVVKELNSQLDSYGQFNSLTCDICDIVGFNSSTGVFQYVEKVHGPQNQLVCEHETCLKVFTSMKTLTKHQRIHNEQKVCENCGKSHHISQCPTQRKSAGGNRHRKMILQGFEEDCRCNLDFSEKNDNFKRHHYKTIHLGYNPCPKCKQLVKDNNKYKVHSCQDKDRMPTFNCKECNASVTSKKGLKAHIQRVHNTESLEQCKFCPKLFTPYNLKNHLKNGPHNVKTKCTICGKSIAKIKVHIETSHKSDIEKRFKCDQCSKGFVSKTQLNSHIMNVHLKLRPYKCRHGCDQDYNDLSNLTQHEKRAHGVLGKRIQEKIQAKLFGKVNGII